MRELLLRKRRKELSEYKAVYIVQTYISSIYEAIQQDTSEILRILYRLYRLLERYGRKSKRHERKTVFDILGVTYEYSKSQSQVA
jgi:hypothetical protein